MRALSGLFIVIGAGGDAAGLPASTISRLDFVGLGSYVSLITQDPIFMRHVLPNTFAVVVGP